VAKQALMTLLMTLLSATMTQWNTSSTANKQRGSRMDQIKLIVAFVREKVLGIVQRIKTALKRD
jgi:predicted membrane protein